MKSSINRLLISVLLPLLVGFAGSLVTSPAIEGWYANVNRPSFAPPNSVFGPVWTLLFILMGIALFLVWQQPVKKSSKKQQLAKKEAVACFLTQLLFNFLWSYLFFGLQLPWAAFVEIIVLWALIAATIIRFERIKPLAAYLLLPYILWVTFASVLNFAFAYIN